MSDDLNGTLQKVYDAAGARLHVVQVGGTPAQSNVSWAPDANGIIQACMNDDGSLRLIIV